MAGSDTEYLGRLLAYWQKRLRLLDWDIDAVYDGSLVKNGELGSIEYAPQHGKATIRVCPKGLGDGFDIPLDEEHTVVHELIHLYFHDFEPERDSLQWERWEYAINKTAAALVAMRRDAPTLESLWNESH